MKENYLPKIAVIIVSYNGQEYLPDCFNSLKKQTLSPEKIIVVDNASQDNSVEYLKENYPSVDLIVNSKNRGFAGANNQGIELAFEEKADYIFLLNQDTVLKSDCLEKLWQGFSKEKENVFALQPLILCWSPQSTNQEKKEQIQTSGDKIHYLGFGFCADYKKIASPENIAKLNKDLTYGSGAALFIKSSLLKKIGFLDQDLFLYHEDLDLCLRARFQNYKIKLLPEAQLYHKYKEGIPRHRWYWSERNRLLTLIKFYKWPTLILILPAALFMEIGILGFSLITGWGHLKIKSYFTCLGQIPKTLIKRKRIQKTRKITDKDLSYYLEPYFNFTGFNNSLIKKIVNPILGTYWKIIRKIIFW
jgi:hypothetical protein